MCQNVLQLYHFTSNSVSHSCFIFPQALVMVSVFNCSPFSGFAVVFFIVCGIFCMKYYWSRQGLWMIFSSSSEQLFLLLRGWQYVGSSSRGNQGIGSFEAGSQVWWPVFCFWWCDHLGQWTRRDHKWTGLSSRVFLFLAHLFFQAVFSELGRLLDALLSCVVSKRPLSL